LSSNPLVLRLGVKASDSFADVVAAVIKVRIRGGAFYTILTAFLLIFFQ
jgi:hypothetical protein